MKFVERASIRPMRCAVMPHIGANHPGGFIDTGSEMLSSGYDQHVYVSKVAVREMARMLGWVAPGDVKTVVAQRDDALARVAELEAELAVTQRNLDAVDQLVSAGFATRRKPGRPKQPQEVQA